LTASDAQKRAWLKDNPHLLDGAQVPAKGRLNPQLSAIYDEHHDDDEPWPGQSEDDDMPVMDMDFGPDDDDEPAAAPEPERVFEGVPVTPERRPSRPRKPSAARSVFSRKPAPGKAKPKGKKAPRVSTENGIARIWGLGARLAAVVSIPVATCLKVQAPIAGRMLDPVVRDTMADRMLQPFCRGIDKAETVGALLLPPAAVLGIERSMSMPPQQGAIFRGICEEALDEGLRMLLKIGGPVMEQMAIENAEFEEKYGQSVAQLKQLILASLYQPQPEDEPEMAGAAA
jgi:hypothetical protein